MLTKLPSNNARRHTTQLYHSSGPVPLFVCTRKCMLFGIFIYIGMSIGLPGCTLISIEKTSSSREDEVALVFSARAMGTLSGWLLTLLVRDARNSSSPANLIVIGAIGLCASYFLLIWAVHIWWVMCGFLFQGSFMIIASMGCRDFITRFHLPYKPHSSQHVIFACLLGCCLTPFVSFPFLRNYTSPLNSHSLSSFVSPHSWNKTFTIVSPGLLPLKRLTRAVVSNVTFVPIEGLNPTTVQIKTSTENNSHLLSTEQATFTPTSISNSTTGSLGTSTTPSVSATFVPSAGTTTLATLPTTSSLPSLATKPAVIDAKHLNQDSSSADGSQAASKMKQISEERKIDTLAGVPVAPLATTLPDGSKTSVTPGVLSGNTIIVEQTNSTLAPFSNTSHVAELISSTTTSEAPNQDISIGMNATEASTLLDQSAITNVTSEHSVSPIPTDYTTAFTSNNTSSDKNISESTTTTVSSTTSTHAPLVPESTTRRIAEHSSTTLSRRQRYFGVRFTPLQNIYLTLCVIGVFVWLMGLPDTDLCRRLCCTSGDPSKADGHNDSVQLRRLSTRDNASPKHSDNLPDVESSEESQRLLDTHFDYVSPVRSHDSLPHLDDEPSQYFSANEKSHPSSSTDRPCGTSTPVDACSSTQAVTTAPPCHLLRLRWPQVSCPADLLLLLAEFTNSGLETAFGAFIHGFTIRYLVWPPVLAFLSVGLFWLGGLVGRLPGLFLFETGSSSRRVRRFGSDPIGSERVRLPEHAAPLSDTSSDVTNWALSVVRLCGAILCVITGVMLTRQSLYTDQYTKTVMLSSPAEFTPKSSDYYIWLGGSLTLGLGIGLSCCMAGSVIATYHVPNAHRLQLAGIMGQMFVPPLIAYAHRLAVFYRYTCVLGISTLILGLVQCGALLGMAFQRRLRRPGTLAEYNQLAQTAEPQLLSSICPDSPNPALHTDTPSPITLHAVQE